MSVELPPMAVLLTVQLMLFSTLPFCSGVCTGQVSLPFLDLGEELQNGDPRTQGDGKLFGVDDSTSPAITLPSALPFGNVTMTTAYVSSNGLISFEQPYSAYVPSPFPLQHYVIAPYWDDIDLSTKGVVLYRTVIPIDQQSHELIALVNDFICSTTFKASWILVARWVNVCPYQDNDCVQTSTFQAVVATNGLISYAIFTYQCGRLNWKRHNPGIGYTASYSRYANHPFTFNTTSNNIACINNSTSPWSNLVYKINDRSDVVLLSPTFGNRAGGSGVLVSGPAFNTTDSVSCVFDGVAVDGVVLDNENALCTTPRLPRTGKIPVRLMLNNVVREHEAAFYSVPYEQANVVDMDTDSLLVKAGQDVRVLWPRQFFVPPISSIPLLNSIVDVKLYERNVSSDTVEPRELVSLAQNIPNSGELSVQIPDIDNMFRGIYTVTIAVEIRSLPQAPNLSSAPAPASALGSAPQYKFTQWMGDAYLAITTSTDRYFRDKCQEWANSQSDEIAAAILDRVASVYPCPPTLSRVQAPNSGFKPDSIDSQIWPIPHFNTLLKDFFHPNTHSCYRQSGGFERTGGHGNQCCYNEKGKIIVGPPGGGTVDRVAPGRSVKDHFYEDVLPFIWCCKGDFPNCATYYRYRPSDDGSRYNPPPPACVYGDPHLVTLDLLKYTFNGYGEFVLIEAVDNSFTLQARMVEATTSDNVNIPATGTIISALAAKETYSDTVQLQLDLLRGIAVLVNGDVVDFNEIKEQVFRNVTVADLGNMTFTATFAGGQFLKVQEANEVISLMIISLPDSLHNQTQGLFGNYNGNASDDLIPRGQKKSLSSNMNLKEIHEQFGITWIIAKETDSIFSYKQGENWATFYRPNYTSLFEPVFQNASLREQARKLCLNDSFCLYDFAATGRMDFALTTFQASQEFDELVALSAPVVCDPPCDNGACVDNNTCSCSEGYEGATCNNAVYTNCDESPCQHNGLCQRHAGSYRCTCMPGYTGYFCQEIDVTTTNATMNTTIPSTDESTMNKIIIIAGAAGGGGLLLLIVTIIIAVLVVCVCMSRRKKKQKPTQNSQMDEEINNYEYLTVAHGNGNNACNDEYEYIEIPKANNSNTACCNEYTEVNNSNSSCSYHYEYIKGAQC